MIRPLRSRHRLWITALAVLLPTGLVLALAARPAPPPPSALPEALQPPDRTLRPLAGWSDLWRGAELSTRLARNGAGDLWLDLEPVTVPAAPDLLVYWTPAGESGSEIGAVLPGEAVLLGAFSGGAYGLKLPPEAAGGGALLLYSLAWGEIAAAAELPPTAGDVPVDPQPIDLQPADPAPEAAP